MNHTGSHLRTSSPLDGERFAGIENSRMELLNRSSRLKEALTPGIGAPASGPACLVVTAPDRRPALRFKESLHGRLALITTPARRRRSQEAIHTPC